MRTPVGRGIHGGFAPTAGIDQADLLGDWREELVYRTEDSTALRIFTTTDVTEHRLRTLMSDPQYRLSIAWQNVAYNQPPHTSYFLGEGMETPDAPSLRYTTPAPRNEPVRGNGRGGRNVEFLLSCALALRGEPGIYGLAADTDGVDGQEEIAGALIGPDSSLAKNSMKPWGSGPAFRATSRSNPASTNGCATSR